MNCTCPFCQNEHNYYFTYPSVITPEWEERYQVFIKQLRKTEAKWKGVKMTSVAILNEKGRDFVAMDRMEEELMAGMTQNEEDNYVARRESER